MFLKYPLCAWGAEGLVHSLSYLILPTFEVHIIIIFNIVILRNFAVKEAIYLKLCFLDLFNHGNLPCEKVLALSVHCVSAPLLNALLFTHSSSLQPCEPHHHYYYLHW